MLAIWQQINSSVCDLLNINPYIQGVICLTCINIIAVLGMSVLTGFTRLFSFGNAGFMSIGAYTCAILVVKLHVPFLIAIPLGMAMAGLVAFLLGSLTLKLNGDYFLITCLGFGEALRVLLNNIEYTGAAFGFSGIPGFSTPLFCILCVVFAFYLSWRLIHSRYGRMLTAVRENELAGRAVAIDTFRAKRLSFVFSAVMAGWAGALYGGYLQYIVPSVFGLGKSCELITTTVIGGLGSLSGSVMGAIIVTLLPEVFRSLETYRMLCYGIAVVLIIMFRPSGIYGYKELTISQIKKDFAALKNIGKKRELKKEG